MKDAILFAPRIFGNSYLSFFIRDLKKYGENWIANHAIRW